MDIDPALVALVRRARTVAVLTGAGISAESGVPTFRDALTGLWARFSPEELATPEAWERQRDIVWAWYLWRARLVRRCAPNDGHRALARWANSARLSISTQNVDDLHERAGSAVLTHLHGSLSAFHCSSCGAPFPEDAIARLELDRPVSLDDAPAPEAPPPCPACAGPVRPSVVWFGEALPDGAMEKAAASMTDAELVIVVGTSGLVQPAASLPFVAKQSGVPIVEVNPVATPLSPHADFVLRGPAAVVLPRLVPSLAGGDDKP